MYIVLDGSGSEIHISGPNSMELMIKLFEKILA